MRVVGDGVRTRVGVRWSGFVSVLGVVLVAVKDPVVLFSILVFRSGDRDCVLVASLDGDDGALDSAGSLGARLGCHSLDRLPCLISFLLRRMQQNMRMAISAIAARPPRTPPMIAPRLEDDVLGRLAVVVGEAAPLDVARTTEKVVGLMVSSVEVSLVAEGSEVATGVLDRDAEVAAVVGSSDIVTASVNVVMEEVVIVLGVTSGSRLIAIAVVSFKSEKVVIVPVASSSSGQTPVVHGSLEQHPRKPPIVQTYHCLPPVQTLASRGKRASRESMLGSWWMASNYNSGQLDSSANE